MDEWKFSESKNTAVIVDKYFAEGKEPCLYVSHDLEDGGWQFLTETTDGNLDRVLVLALSTIVSLDKSLNTISDLPPGWIATRESIDSEWQRKSRMS